MIADGINEREEGTEWERIQCHPQEEGRGGKQMQE